MCYSGSICSKCKKTFFETGAFENHSCITVPTPSFIDCKIGDQVFAYDKKSGVLVQGKIIDLSSDSAIIDGFKSNYPAEPKGTFAVGRAWMSFNKGA